MQLDSQPNPFFSCFGAAALANPSGSESDLARSPSNPLIPHSGRWKAYPEPMRTHRTVKTACNAEPSSGATVLRSGPVLRVFWVVLGCISLAVAVCGLVLPVLPTTPFVILSAFLFSKSSPSLAEWLNRNRVFGPIIADWRVSGAIAIRYKVMALVMMAGAFALSLAMSMPAIVLLVQAICILAAGTFILSRPNRATA